MVTVAAMVAEPIEWDWARVFFDKGTDWQPCHCSLWYLSAFPLPPGPIHVRRIPCESTEGGDDSREMFGFSDSVGVNLALDRGSHDLCTP